MGIFCIVVLELDRHTRGEVYFMAETYYAKDWFEILGMGSLLMYGLLTGSLTRYLDLPTTEQIVLSI